MMLWLLGLASAAFTLWVLWLLTDGVRAMLSRRVLEARKRALQLIVTARADATSELFRLTLARADGKRLPRFRAGQYLTLRTPAGTRRYSLSAWTAKPRAYQLGIRRVDGGQVSGWLHDHAQPGVRLEVLPPAGEFVLTADAGEIVLAAGGIGVTPMAAMLDELKTVRAAHSTGGVWLFHAARHAAELIEQTRHTELDRTRPGFHFRPFLSRPGHDWAGGRGRLTAADLTRELADPHNARFYLCARQEMMDELAAGLVALGVNPARIHWESFGGAGNGDRNEYRVKVAGHGEHVFQGEPSLLHALEAWGVPIQADCRAGECGACRVRLKSGAVRQCQQPAAAISGQLDTGNYLACCCVPSAEVEIELSPS